MKKVSILSLALLSIIFLSSCSGGSSPTGSSYSNETGSGEGSGNSGGGNNGGGNNNGGGTGVTNIAVSSSGGVYVINGVTTGNLSLEKGMTYTFTNSSSSAHPFRLSATMDGTHGGGSTYGIGVTYSGNVLTFVVPSTAPTTLYYYCTVHAGMGGSGSITITGGTSGSSNNGGESGGESGGTY